MPAHVSNDRLATRNALILAVAGALAGGNAAVMFLTVAIVGTMLAPFKALATLPISVYAIGLAAASLPVGWLVHHHGRRTTYIIASGVGIATGLFNMAAVLAGNFWLLCIGAFCAGFYASAIQSYRFAATDLASAALKPKLMSWVMFGGLAGAFVGPQLANFTKDLWQPYMFAATYLGQAALALMAMIVVSFVRTPVIDATQRVGGRPLSVILRQPRLIAAILAGAMSYVVMNYVMTAAPLAMVGCNHTFADASSGITWHIVGMYAPSLFTGTLIVRFGAIRIAAIGFALLVAAGAVALHGLSVAHFMTSLILLGLGWNFSFLGASAMVTECHRPEEKARVQSFNDLMVFSCVAVGSLSAGYMQNIYGWDMVNLMTFPLIALALLAIIVLPRLHHRQAA